VLLCVLLCVVLRFLLRSARGRAYALGVAPRTPMAGGATGPGRPVFSTDIIIVTFMEVAILGFRDIVKCNTHGNRKLCAELCAGLGRPLAAPPPPPPPPLPP
jgi:hypothetical protein